uniref:Uncharacterized protein n=1 Tax=Timema genevievae TaxID=629358 RepID=A0A7R9PSA1_TIMGE|nr:unnamed protein product [Timema genevievae]
MTLRFFVLSLSTVLRQVLTRHRHPYYLLSGLSVDRDQNLDLPVLRSLAHHETCALANCATEAEFLQAVFKIHKEYGSIFRLWLGGDLFVVLSNPKYIEVILGSNKLIDKGVIYKYLYDWLGSGLLTSTGKIDILAYFGGQMQRLAIYGPLTDLI